MHLFLSKCLIPTTPLTKNEQKSLSTGKFVKHHLVASGKSVADRRMIAEHMARSAATVILRSIPGKPERGKWTKTPPACAFVSMAHLNGLMGRLLAAAGGMVKVTVQHFDGKWAGLSFGESQGVRYGISVQFYQSDVLMFRVRLSVLVFNATRAIHVFFLHLEICSHRVRDRLCSTSSIQLTLPSR